MTDEDIAIPESFLAMPRWWTEGVAWLSDLPGLVRAQCHRWDLRITADVVHGSNAWVVFRTIDYWLWGLSRGLTEDPMRCQRLAAVFVA